MKRILFTLFLSIVFLSSYAQTSTNIATVLSTPKDTSPANIVFVVKTPGAALNRWGVANFDSLRIKPWNLVWLSDTIISVGDSRYAQLLGAYSNPSFVNSLSAAKVFGLSPVALSGDYNDLTNLPNLNLKYDISNPAGYIAGITSGMIIGALGYTPYDASNPNGYITSASITNKQNYSDTSSWDATRFWVQSQGYLIGSDTTSLSNRINLKLNISDTIGKWKSASYTPSSSEITTALGFTPVSNTRTLTINGNTQDLSTNRTWNVGTVTSVALSSTDLSVSGSPITTSGTITTNLNTTGVTAGSYIGTYTVDSKGRLTAANNPTITSVAAGARNFNQAYQVSTTKYSVVRFSNTISCNLSLSGGQSGEVYLEYSADGSTNWILAGKSVGSNTGTLTIGLNTTQLTGGELSVMLPPGYYWRFRTNNVTGSPVYSFTGGTETVY